MGRKIWPSPLILAHKYQLQSRVCLELWKVAQLTGSFNLRTVRAKTMPVAGEAEASKSECSLNLTISIRQLKSNADSLVLETNWEKYYHHLWYWRASISYKVEYAWSRGSSLGDFWFTYGNKRSFVCSGKSRSKSTIGVNNWLIILTFYILNLKDYNLSVYISFPDRIWCFLFSLNCACFYWPYSYFYSKSTLRRCIK